MSPVGPLFWDEGVKTAFPVSRLPAGKGTRGVADLSAVREFQGFRSDAGIVSLLIHIHFSETSRETFTDKVVRLIENDKDSVTN